MPHQPRYGVTDPLACDAGHEPAGCRSNSLAATIMQMPDIHSTICRHSAASPGSSGKSSANGPASSRCARYASCRGQSRRCARDIEFGPFTIAGKSDRADATDRILRSRSIGPDRRCRSSASTAAEHERWRVQAEMGCRDPAAHRRPISSGADVQSEIGRPARYSSCSNAGHGKRGAPAARMA